MVMTADLVIVPAAPSISPGEDVAETVAEPVDEPPHAMSIAVAPGPGWFTLVAADSASATAGTLLDAKVAW